MTSATEVLRRMLDERGVKYDTDDEDGCEFTEWVANGLEWEADSRGELVSLMPVMLITPEQAIAATLGSCNCSDNCTDGERTGTCRDVYLLIAMDIGDGREEVLGVYATEEAATAAISENQFGYALHHVRKWEVEQ